MDPCIPTLNCALPTTQALSQFYLAAFLASLQDQGYTICEWLACSALYCTVRACLRDSWPRRRKAPRASMLQAVRPGQNAEHKLSMAMATLACLIACSTAVVVRGQLPRPQAPAQPGPAGPGRWFSVDEVGGSHALCC